MEIKELLNKTQIDLKKYMLEYLKSKGYKKSIISTDEYILGIGEIPILLVAHLDTVHTTLPENIYYDKEQKCMWSPQGIGGDDRCGVFAIAKIIEKYKPFVLLTTDEEIGGVGAECFTNDIQTDLKKHINFIIELDRRGSNDAVFYQCGNEEFKKYILNFGFEENYGTFTDISILSPAYDIASVNLSVGYYNEHQKIEYIKLDDLYSTIDKVEKILDDVDNHKYYDYQPKKVSYYTNSYNNKDFEYDYTDLYEDDYNDLTDKEFYDYYGIKKPKTLKEFLDYMGC